MHAWLFGEWPYRFSKDCMSTSSQVRLVGRLGDQVRSKEVPSGDMITSFTVILDRSASERAGSSTPVNAIACVTSRARVRSVVPWRSLRNRCGRREPDLSMIVRRWRRGRR